MERHRQSAAGERGDAGAAAADRIARGNSVEGEVQSFVLLVRELHRFARSATDILQAEAWPPSQRSDRRQVVHRS